MSTRYGTPTSRVPTKASIRTTGPFMSLALTPGQAARKRVMNPNPRHTQRTASSVSLSCWHRPRDHIGRGASRKSARAQPYTNGRQEPQGNRETSTGKSSMEPHSAASISNRPLQRLPCANRSFSCPPPKSSLPCVVEAAHWGTVGLTSCRSAARLATWAFRYTRCMVARTVEGRMPRRRATSDEDRSAREREATSSSRGASP